MNVWHTISTESQIIVIHPNYPQHRFLLSTLLDVDNVEYCLLTANLSTQDFMFATPPEFIVLDEFDCLPEPQATALLDAMLKTYPESRIIIFSRQLPDLQKSHRSKASLFPIDEPMGLVDYYQAKHTIIEFFGLGGGAVAVNGKRISAWEDELQPLLLFYLLEMGATSREVLLREFWPEKSVQAAIRALHNLKAGIHKLLKVEAITYDNSLYQINPAYEIMYDVWRYKSLIDEAYNANTPQGLDLTHFAQAHDAYTGEFLEGRRKKWIIDCREKLQSLLAEADFRLAKILADYGEKDKAAAWFSFAFQLDSTRDDIMKVLMRFFIDLGLPCQAMHFFYRYEENLHEKHGITPGKQILALADEAHAACYSSSSL